MISSTLIKLHAKINIMKSLNTAEKRRTLFTSIHSKICHNHSVLTKIFREDLLCRGYCNSNFRQIGNDNHWSHIESAVKSNSSCLIVLDDDPTGCQTVYGVRLLLDNSVECLLRQLRDRANDKLFYILTNTRALTEEDAIKMTKQTLHNLFFAASLANYDVRRFRIISRSDSTLRGHFPAETDTIESVLKDILNRESRTGSSIISYHSATLLVPAFFEGGRTTVEDVHYMQTEKGKLPVGESIFARDPHFPYKHSNLKNWVEEKTNGRITADSVKSISLDTIREGPESVERSLLKLPLGAVAIVNAETYADLNSFSLGLLRAEASKRFLVRSAASFVASRAALRPLPLLHPGVIENAAGGLVVVGSHVEKSTLQLQHLLQHGDVQSIELHVPTIIQSLRDCQQLSAENKGLSQEFMFALLRGGNTKAGELIASIESRLLDQISRGRHCVLFTSRGFFEKTTSEESAFVAFVMTKIVQSTISRSLLKPAYIVAKGGITSHEMAKVGLGIVEADVLGQLEPGVPMWRVGDGREAFQYVVFPGNVGDVDSLTKVCLRMGMQPRSINSSSESDSSQAKVPSETASSSSSSSSPPPQLLSKGAQDMLRFLKDTRSRRCALGAFNVYNIEGALAVAQSAEKLSTPAILQVHPAAIKFGSGAFLSFLRKLADDHNERFKHKLDGPRLFLHLDHATDEADVLLALRHGVDSIMLDGSHLPFLDNLNWTSRLSQFAKSSFGVLVEAELGLLAGEEDGLVVEERLAKMTDPAQVVQFVKEGQLDLLAVTIGNVHGKYALPPNLDLDRLSRIAANLKRASLDPVLVLHGASGLSRRWIEQTLDLGIAKFNVNTDLRAAAVGALKQIAPNKSLDLLPLMSESKRAMQVVVEEKMNLFSRRS